MASDEAVWCSMCRYAGLNIFVRFMRFAETSFRIVRLFAPYVVRLPFIGMAFVGVLTSSHMGIFYHKKAALFRAAVGENYAVRFGMATTLETGSCHLDGSFSISVRPM